MYLNYVSYKHAQLLWVDPYTENRLCLRPGSTLDCQSFGMCTLKWIKKLIKLTMHYTKIFLLLVSITSTERDSTPLYRMRSILYGLTLTRGQAQFRVCKQGQINKGGFPVMAETTRNQIFSKEISQVIIAAMVLAPNFC